MIPMLFAKDYAENNQILPVVMKVVPVTLDVLPTLGVVKQLTAVLAIAEPGKKWRHRCSLFLELVRFQKNYNDGQGKAFFGNELTVFRIMV
jgi:hypothetical protein